MTFSELVTIYDFVGNAPTEYKKENNMNEILLYIENGMQEYFHLEKGKIDVDTLRKLTCTGSAVCFINIEFGWEIFMEHIKQEPLNKILYRKFYLFLYTYGWELESKVLKKYIDLNDLESAAVFCKNLQLYDGDSVKEMTDTDISTFLKRLGLQ